MQDNNVPTKIVLPWGASAASPYIGSIPVASQIGITASAASLTDGFPPQTAQAGGAPRIQDMNGIINLMTAWNRWQSAGGPMYYDSAFSSAIGGYPAGALLNATSALGNYWISTVDNNTSDPDTGGANWIWISLTPQTSRMMMQRVRPVTTPPATLTNGTWMTWPINIVTYNGIIGATLNSSSGQITLPTGQFIARYGAMCSNGGRHYCRLFDNTTPAYLGFGLTGDSYSNSTENLTSSSTGECAFTLTSSKIVTLDHINLNAGPALMGDATTAGGGSDTDAYVTIERVG